MSSDREGVGGGTACWSDDGFGDGEGRDFLEAKWSVLIEFFRNTEAPSSRTFLQSSMAGMTPEAY
jgi:hypothetical protein